jgi:four helix bundle protein
MSEFAEKLKQRTNQFAIDIIQFTQTFPKSDEAFIIKKQLLRSSFSVAANYRAVCRARSDAEFFSKLSIVVEEADEVLFWIELLTESKIIKMEESKKYSNEAKEILSIVAKSRKTLREKNQISIK